MNITDILRDHGVDIGTSDILGERLVDGSVGMPKLSQEVQDKINNAATSVVITPIAFDEFPNVYPIGFSMFDVPASHDYGEWLTVFGISQIDSTPYTKLRVYTDRTSDFNVTQRLVVVDANSKLKYISERTSVGSQNDAFEAPSIVYGIPSVEVVNDFTTGGATKAASAETVKILKTELDSVVPAPAYGVERINDNHAIKRFPIFNEWASDVNYEYFDILLPNISLSGEIRVRMVSTTGGAETIIHFERPTVGAAVAYTSLVTSTISPLFARAFRTPLNITASAANDWQILIGVLKREKKAPLYVEVELLTTLGNAGDALDATIARIGTQGTTPYLGVIQTGALEKAVDAVTMVSANMSFYVNPTTGNDDTGVINNSDKKFKTIQACIDRIPYVLNGVVNIFLDAGTYQNANIIGILGGGSISIRSTNGDFANSANYQMGSITARGCSVQISLLGIQFGTGAASSGVFAARCSYLLVQSCRCTSPTGSYAVSLDATLANINTCDISNRSQVVMLNNMSTAVVTSITGTGNTVGLFAASGSTIIKVGSQASAGTPESVVTGGLIRS